MAFFNNSLWKNYQVDFHKIFRVCSSCKGLLLCKFSYSTELFNILKIELENGDFHKSLYFYIKWTLKKEKKNGLSLGAGIILNQELTYSGHCKNMGCGRLPAP